MRRTCAVSFCRAHASTPSISAQTSPSPCPLAAAGPGASAGCRTGHLAAVQPGSITPRLCRVHAWCCNTNMLTVPSIGAVQQWVVYSAGCLTQESGDDIFERLRRYCAHKHCISSLMMLCYATVHTCMCACCADRTPSLQYSMTMHSLEPAVKHSLHCTILGCFRAIRSCSQ